jgi:hypothetical protein
MQKKYFKMASCGNKTGRAMTNYPMFKGSNADGKNFIKGF